MFTTYFIVALFGLAFGSFLNVCIFRLSSEHKESIVTPGSHCRKCGRPIHWYDNLPLLSYLLLRGRCRSCGTRISLIYPLVEALTAGVFVLAWTAYGPTPRFIKCVIFSMLLVVIIFTDLLERTIPRPITVFGMSSGLFFSLLVPVDDRLSGWTLGKLGLDAPRLLASALSAVAGAIFGAGLFYAVGELFSRLRGKQALGFGDVMLMGMVGTFLGVSLTYVTILLGSVIGTIVAGTLYAASAHFRRGYLWPYGSFLAAAALYVTLGGQALLEAYLRWSGLAQ
jgi:leader peptidase (prepilin peptidase) / N-methyltransferase